MKRQELLARLLITVMVLGAVAIPLVARARNPLVHARMAEDGGWSPEILRATVGEPLHLRLTSDDVMHGFAVGQMDVQSVDILPGKVTELTLLFDRPGTYTYYCTRWCGLNHWRMRGTIEVTGDSPAATQPASAPLYTTLGHDIDAPHESPSIPAARPSALSGEKLVAGLALSGFLSQDSYRAQSPYQTWLAMRAGQSRTGLSDQQIWDVVASLWRASATSDGLAQGRQLYAQNCAACHGEAGAGDGVFSDAIAGPAQTAGGTLAGMQGMAGSRPVDFTDPTRMLGASPALLQGKILRGGMGTGMPMWGSVFTEDQIWDLVAYLYTFQFDYR